MGKPFFGRLRNLFKLSHKHQEDLLEQKYIDLMTTSDRMRLHQDVVDKYSHLLAKIDEVFEREHSWDHANIVEQLLAPMYNEAELDIEIKLNLLEAKRRLGAESCQFFNDTFDGNLDVSGKLNLLCNLYKKLQISYDLEDKKEQLMSATRFLTSGAFFLSIMMFFLFDNLRLIKAVMEFESSDKIEFTVAAIAAGWMGACFSMLMRMKVDINSQSLAELTAACRIDNLISRSLIGMVSGLLFFFAFESTILQGALFPALEFDHEGVFNAHEEKWTENKAHAMLVFWCFIAGFSEKMVPELLAKAEKQGENEGR